MMPGQVNPSALTQVETLPTKTPQKISQKLEYLDCIRALAALYVVIYHIIKYIDFSAAPQNLTVRLVKYLASGFYHGDYAVAVFITLSGFCLMLPVVRSETQTIRGGLLNFFKRRAQRIMPPYYFAIAFSLILIGLFIGQETGSYWDRCIPVTAKSILTHFLLIHDLTGDASNINHTLWSIAVEWRIYFLFPLLIMSWRDFGALGTSLVAVIGSFLLVYLDFIFGDSGSHFDYIGLFSLGMLGTTIAFSQKYVFTQWRKLPWSWIVLTITIAILFLSRTKLWHPLMPTLINYVVGLWAMSLMIVGAHIKDTWFHKLLSFKPLIGIGLFSYSIYLIHGPILQIIWQYWLSSLHVQPIALLCAMILIGLPVVLGVSYLFFWFCERPFLRKHP